MAKTVQIEKRKRGIVGWFFLLLFIGFNILMLASLIAGIGGSAEAVSGMNTDAERAGAGLGMVLGFGMILSLWVMGDIILGLFVLLTRGKKIITTETID